MRQRPYAVIFLAIQSFIRSAKNLLDAVPIVRIFGNAHTRGDRWMLRILRQSFENAMRHLTGLLKRSLWQHQCKFVTAVARRRVGFAGMQTQHHRNAAERPAAYHVSE